eukprot:TRINITY_DN3915_c0_g1_i1.p1 TRINITY_DN3915_c0_g1~~TRINITY_DN3915_c0_g1_i1.p1  ORF type:complete len:201 (-),score=79.36 TRINITY_DN3915_c0_g1_i1:733-1335(-)
MISKSILFLFLFFLVLVSVVSTNDAKQEGDGAPKEDKGKEGQFNEQDLMELLKNYNGEEGDDEDDSDDEAEHFNFDDSDEENEHPSQMGFDEDEALEEMWNLDRDEDEGDDEKFFASLDEDGDEEEVGDVVDELLPLADKFEAKILSVNGSKLNTEKQSISFFKQYIQKSQPVLLKIYFPLMAKSPKLEKQRCGESSFGG